MFFPIGQIRQEGRSPVLPLVAEEVERAHSSSFIVRFPAATSLTSLLAEQMTTYVTS
jgi:hypothetical protein